MNITWDTNGSPRTTPVPRGVQRRSGGAQRRHTPAHAAARAPRVGVRPVLRPPPGGGSRRRRRHRTRRPGLPGLGPGRPRRPPRRRAPVGARRPRRRRPEPPTRRAIALGSRRRHRPRRVVRRGCRDGPTRARRRRSGPAVLGFGPKPRTASFWQRRMPHETTLHAWDAARALGYADPLDRELAADGVDEVVTIFVPRQVRLGRLEPAAVSVELRATDAPGWGPWRLAPAGVVPDARTPSCRRRPRSAAPAVAARALRRPRRGRWRDRGRRRGRRPDRARAAPDPDRASASPPGRHAFSAVRMRSTRSCHEPSV